MRGALSCVVLLLLSAAVSAACTCVNNPSPKTAVSSARMVFRGTVIRSDRLPEHPLMKGRQRYRVTFRVNEQWKGTLAKTVTLYDVDPGTDCQGAGFGLGQEYLVYARQEKSRDYRLDPDFFWLGWTDVIPEGSPMLVPVTACMPWGNTRTRGVQRFLRELGKGSALDR